jgi:DNA-directed RNA polymerase specialized sigma24 family protein
MEIIPLQPAIPDKGTECLSPEEVANELATLSASPAKMRKLELSIRLGVMRYKGADYGQLEKDLIQEAMVRLLSTRKWPRHVSAVTMMIKITESIIYDLRMNADALALNRVENPPSREDVDGGDWLEAKHSHIDVRRATEIANTAECLEELKQIFADDEIAWEVLSAKHLCGYEPKEIQDLLNLTETEYQSKLTKISRRIKSALKTKSGASK